MDDINLWGESGPDYSSNTIAEQQAMWWVIPATLTPEHKERLATNKSEMLSSSMSGPKQLLQHALIMHLHILYFQLLGFIYAF